MLYSIIEINSFTNKNVPQDYSTREAAINAAVDLDKILVAEGAQA